MNFIKLLNDVIWISAAGHSLPYNIQALEWESSLKDVYFCQMINKKQKDLLLTFTKTWINDSKGTVNATLFS